MTTRPRLPCHLLVLAVLIGLAGPALAADAPAPALSRVAPAVDGGSAPEAAPTVTPAESPLDSALEQGLDPQYGDCALWCDGQQYWYYFVTREECCSGTLTCPGGAPSSGYAFYPYQGFAEFCSI